jgi:uncharacterized protein
MPKGFGSLTPERRRAISSAGGKAAHAAGTAHRFNHAEAVAAGSKGGRASKKREMALAALGPQGIPAGEEPKGLNGPTGGCPDCPHELPPVGPAFPVAPTEPPPPSPPTEPAPPLVVEETTNGPAHPDSMPDKREELETEAAIFGFDIDGTEAVADEQGALDAVEAQRVHDEAMARS